MRRLMRTFLGVLLASAAHCGWAAIACTLSATPVPFQGIYSSTADLQIQGSFTVTCTRDPNNDTRKPDIWIGLNQGNTGNTLPRDIGGSSLPYTVSRRTFGSGIWTGTGGQSPNSSSTGGLLDAIDFGNRGATFSATYDIYFQVASGLTRPAGVYLDTINATLRLGSDSAAILSTTTLSLLVSIPKDCRFSTSPTPIAVVYPAFSPTPVTATSSFALTCTQGTTYTVALDRTRSVIPTVQLAYTLGLSASSGTGTAVAQAFTVDVNVLPGQAGTCGGANCSGTDTRTITITY